MSLDGYVDHDKKSPAPGLLRHFIEQVRGVAGMVYGRGMYDVMRYWDDEDSDWSELEREYALVWRKQPKWVVSRSLHSVGSNATLIAHDAESAIRDLKGRFTGEIEVAGPELARSLTTLIDEYRLYIRLVVLGRGKPFFAELRARWRR